MESEDVENKMAAQASFTIHVFLPVLLFLPWKSSNPSTQWALQFLPRVPAHSELHDTGYALFFSFVPTATTTGTHMSSIWTVSLSAAGNGSWVSHNAVKSEAGKELWCTCVFVFAVSLYRRKRANGADVQCFESYLVGCSSERMFPYPYLTVQRQ